MLSFDFDQVGKEFLPASMERFQSPDSRIALVDSRRTPSTHRNDKKGQSESCVLRPRAVVRQPGQFELNGLTSRYASTGPPKQRGPTRSIGRHFTPAIDQRRGDVHGVPFFDKHQELIEVGRESLGQSKRASRIREDVGYPYWRQTRTKSTSHPNPITVDQRTRARPLKNGRPLRP